MGANTALWTHSVLVLFSQTALDTGTWRLVKLNIYLSHSLSVFKIKKHNTRPTLGATQSLPFTWAVLISKEKQVICTVVLRYNALVFPYWTLPDTGFKNGKQFEALSLMLQTDNKEREKRALIFSPKYPWKWYISKQTGCMTQMTKNTLKCPIILKGLTSYLNLLAHMQCLPKQLFYFFTKIMSSSYAHTFRIFQSTDVLLWETRNPVPFWWATESTLGKIQLMVRWKSGPVTREWVARLVCGHLVHEVVIV